MTQSPTGRRASKIGKWRQELVMSEKIPLINQSDALSGWISLERFTCDRIRHDNIAA